MSTVSNIAQAPNQQLINYDTIDLANNEWTNMTLSNDNFLVMADNAYIDGLSGRLYYYNIQSLVDAVDFFNLSLNMENYTMRIEISLNGLTNAVFIDQARLLVN